MSKTTQTRHNSSGEVSDAPPETGATNGILSISIDSMSEQRRLNREYQRRWYYRNGGRPQDDHRRALVRAAVARHAAKKKAEKEKVMQ